MLTWKIKRNLTVHLAASVLGVTFFLSPAQAQDQANNAAMARIAKKNNQTILRGSGLYAAPIAIFVNGKQAASGAFITWTDITPYVKPGENTLRVTSQKGGFVFVSHAPTAGKFRQIGRFDLGNRGGSKNTYTFTLPGSGMDDSQGKAPVAGSANRQVIVKSTSIKPVEIFLNGKRVGSTQIGQNLDVGNFVKPGENTLRVVWSKPGTTGFVKVAYANRKNMFRDIAGAQVNIALQKARSAGEETITFQFDPDTP